MPYSADCFVVCAAGLSCDPAVHGSAWFERASALVSMRTDCPLCARVGHLPDMQARVTGSVAAEVFYGPLPGHTWGTYDPADGESRDATRRMNSLPDMVRHLFLPNFTARPLSIQVEGWEIWRYVQAQIALGRRPILVGESQGGQVMAHVAARLAISSKNAPCLACCVKLQARAARPPARVGLQCPATRGRQCLSSSGMCASFHCFPALCCRSSRFVQAGLRS
jgi:hypothetical protein